MVVHTRPRLPLGLQLFTVSTFALEQVSVFYQADQQLVKKGRSKVGDMLEKAAELLMSCFRVCASDT